MAVCWLSTGSSGVLALYGDCGGQGASWPRLRQRGGEGHRQRGLWGTGETDLANSLLDRHHEDGEEHAGLELLFGGRAVAVVGDDGGDAGVGNVDVGQHSDGGLLLLHACFSLWLKKLILI